MTQYARALGWFAFYVLLVVMPAIVAAVTDPITASRPALLEFSVGLGLLAFSLILVQFALVSHVKGSSRPFGTDALVAFHGYMGLLALAFVLLHPALLNLQGLPLTTWLPTWRRLSIFRGAAGERLKSVVLKCFLTAKSCVLTLISAGCGGGSCRSRC